MFRVIYTDVKAINDEIGRQKQQEEQMEKEKQQEIENKQKCLHNRIIKQMWNLGIRDKQVLMLVKKIIKFKMTIQKKIKIHKVNLLQMKIHKRLIKKKLTKVIKIMK